MKYKAIYSFITIYCTILASQNVCATISCELFSNQCDECLVHSSKCVWCSTINFNGTRCRSELDNLDNWCVGNDVIKPKSASTPKGAIRDFSSKTDEIVQIKPQNIQINLRPGDSIDFQFSIKLAKDYPVDLYFLVDSSKLMKGVQKIMVDESAQMYKTMKRMTSDVFFGTGTFVDKNALPFTNYINDTLTYSFRNRLKLINNHEEFQKTVNDTEFGYNFDNPEGTLDALSQVITCDHQIRWRKESTKIIIVLTDSPYHSAGDSKWAGINRPYDGKCYTVNGIYKNELKMDYPSVNIIKKLAAEREIIILFIVEESQKNSYESLRQALGSPKLTLYKDNKSFSIKKVLKQQYENIKQILKLKVNMDSTYREHFNFSFFPDCYKSDTKNFNKMRCMARIGKEKVFNGTLTLLNNMVQATDVNIGILAEGIKEKLNLDIAILKSCNCPVHQNSPECNSAGSLICGVCNCNEDRFGSKCKCDKKSKGVKPNDNSTCISPTSSDNVLCSGHGACDCGKCSCINKDYSGSYCECYKNTCPLYNDLVCSDHGQCVCGKCKCDQGFTYDDCRCSLAKDNCMVGEKECNSRGQCKCNTCECSDPSVWDARRNGHLCQLKCTEESCHSYQCQLLEPIVLCYLNQEGCEPHTDVNITGVTNLTDRYSANYWANYSANCPNVRTGIGCYTAFLYQYNEDIYGIKIVVQTDTYCAETYYKYGGICAGVLIICSLIGLIVWKWITSVRDRKEYERFLQEAGGSSCENPIYLASSQTYNNPRFRKRSDRRKFSLR